MEILDLLYIGYRFRKYYSVLALTEIDIVEIYCYLKMWQKFRWTFVKSYNVLRYLINFYFARLAFYSLPNVLLFCLRNTKSQLRCQQTHKLQYSLIKAFSATRHTFSCKMFSYNTVDAKKERNRIPCMCIVTIRYRHSFIWWYLRIFYYHNHIDQAE